MIPIDIAQLRRTAKQDAMDALTEFAERLSAATNVDERSEIIDQGTPIWGALRHDLWKAGNLKCWYSEKVLEADSGEVEHFRPKKKVWKSVPAHGGYWWRAFDWRNFRLAHPLVNKRRKDYSTDELAGKGCYFPLREESARANCAAEEAAEHPVLLDPTKPADCRLIRFDTASGRPIASVKREADEWKWRRATETIKFYHLDEGTWNAERADQMVAVTKACDDLLVARQLGDRLEEDRQIDVIHNFIKHTAEFSSASKQIVAEKGLIDIFANAPEPS